LFPRFLNLKHIFDKPNQQHCPASLNEKQKGWQPRQPVLLIDFRLVQPYYLAPAAAATAGVPTLTLICFGLASSRFGMTSVKTPF